jgi:hypothetical protein
MLKKNAQKNDERFHCAHCDYSTSKKSSWNQHLATRKHINATNAIFNAINATEKYAQEVLLNICSGCGKKYKHASSLYRHKKICSKYAQTENEEIITMTKKEYNLALENQELKPISYQTQLQLLLIVVLIVIILRISIYNYIYKRNFLQLSISLNLLKI